MKNFKKRWFRLTNHEFTYQKSKGNKKSLLFAGFHIFYSEGPEPCLSPRQGEPVPSWERWGYREGAGGGGQGPGQMLPSWHLSLWRSGDLASGGRPRVLRGGCARPLLLRARSAAGDPPLYSIPIENILAVEPLEEESFKMKNVSVPPPLACALVLRLLLEPAWSSLNLCAKLQEQSRAECAPEGLVFAFARLWSCVPVPPQLSVWDVHVFLNL